MYTLDDICLLITDGSHFSPEDEGDGYPMLSVKDMGDSDFNFSNCKHVGEESFKKLSANGCVPQIDDVVVAKDGSYLKTAFPICEERNIALLSSIAILRPNTALVYPAYLSYFLKSEAVYRTVSLNYISGTALKRIILKGIKKIPILLPDLEEQKRRAALLDQLYDIMQKRRLQLSAFDDLIRARFVETFGDPLLNPMNWQEKKLEEIADIVSGITKGRKVQSTDLYEVPYMAVSNVKDGFIDWTTVKTILATQAEIEQYRLLPNDVLMTEGGDPDKLGRGAIIHEPPSDCIHQNHIFRVRLDQSRITPEYMEQYLQHQKAKRYFLGCAKQTTGIASINMKQLRALPMLMPPIALQQEFSEYVSQIDKSKSVIQKSLDETQLLFDSLMQKYFG